MSNLVAKPVAPLSEYAISVRPDDNVAVVRQATTPGLTLALPHGGSVVVKAVVPPGHRFATREIPAGASVLQYGQPIGTSMGICAGETISHANMSDEIKVVREVPEHLHTPPPDYLPSTERGTFLGFRRPDGRTGTRNFILIVPTSMCASHEASQTALRAEFMLYDRERFPNVDGVVAIPHNKGCGCQDGSNLDVMLRTLANYAAHPNVGGVVLLDLGCEKTNLTLVEKYLLQREKELQKPVAKLGIQEVGGTRAAIEKGLEYVAQMLPEVNRAARAERSVSELVLGVKCGGSDGFSGISANPALGCAADSLVRSGGTVLLTEVPEFCGAEHLLAQRAKDAATSRAVYEMVDWYKRYASKFGAKLGENPSPGNMAGGLLNITLKSLGAIAKAGTTRVEGVIGYGESVAEKGVNLMQGPGYDQESTPGLVAAGANVVVFTTGRGTTIGNAIAPVIKLASNNAVFARMRGDIDLTAGNVLEGKETLEEVGERVFEYVRRVASGEIEAKAEEQKHREFQCWGEESVSL